MRNLTLRARRHLSAAHAAVVPTVNAGNCIYRENNGIICNYAFVGRAPTSGRVALRFYVLFTVRAFARFRGAVRFGMRVVKMQSVWELNLETISLNRHHRVQPV